MEIYRDKRTRQLGSNPVNHSGEVDLKYIIAMLLCDPDYYIEESIFPGGMKSLLTYLSNEVEVKNGKQWDIPVVVFFLLEGYKFYLENLEAEYERGLGTGPISPGDPRWKDFGHSHIETQLQKHLHEFPGWVGPDDAFKRMFPWTTELTLAKIQGAKKRVKESYPGADAIWGWDLPPTAARGDDEVADDAIDRNPPPSLLPPPLATWEVEEEWWNPDVNGFRVEEIGTLFTSIKNLAVEKLVLPSERKDSPDFGVEVLAPDGVTLVPFNVPVAELSVFAPDADGTLRPVTIIGRAATNQYYNVRDETKEWIAQVTWSLPCRVLSLDATGNNFFIEIAGGSLQKWVSREQVTQMVQTLPDDEELAEGGGAEGGGGEGRMLPVSIISVGPPEAPVVTVKEESLQSLPDPSPQCILTLPDGVHPGSPTHEAIENAVRLLSSRKLDWERILGEQKKIFLEHIMGNATDSPKFIIEMIEDIYLNIRDVDVEGNRLSAGNLSVQYIEKYYEYSLHSEIKKELDMLNAFREIEVKKIADASGWGDAAAKAIIDFYAQEGIINIDYGLPTVITPPVLPLPVAQRQLFVDAIKDWGRRSLDTITPPLPLQTHRGKGAPLAIQITKNPEETKAVGTPRPRGPGEGVVKEERGTPRDHAAVQALQALQALKPQALKQQAGKQNTRRRGLRPQPYLSGKGPRKRTKRRNNKRRNNKRTKRRNNKRTKRKQKEKKKRTRRIKNKNKTRKRN